MPEMTPAQAREWFAKNDIISGNWGYFDTEQLYQAFKTRLIEETTCCELPKEGR